MLITVMSEGELHVPRLGRVAAAPGFRLVAAMNPFDAVGTARISSAVYDRMCRLSMDYQDAADEAAIVAREAGEAAADLRWLTGVVDAGAAHPRRTPTCASARRCGAPSTWWWWRRGWRRCGAWRPSDWRVGLDAALVALSGRVRVREGGGRTAEDVIAELWATIFGAAGR